VPGKSNNAKEDSKDSETTKLNGFTTNGIDSSDGEPVTWNGTSHDENNVTNGVLVENLIDITEMVSEVHVKLKIYLPSSAISNSSENNGIVQRDTVESNVKEKP